MSSLTPTKGGSSGSSSTTVSPGGSRGGTTAGGSSFFLADVLRELGPETCDHATFTDILQQLSPKLKGPTLERNVAAALVMMFNFSNSPAGSGTEPTQANTWDIKAFAMACLETFKTIDINRLMTGLQETPPNIIDATGATQLIQTLNYFDKRLMDNLDVNLLCILWKNPSTQLRLLLCLLALPPDIFNLASLRSSEPVIRVTDYTSMGAPPAVIQLADSLSRCSWNCLPLYRFVSAMIDSEYFEDAKPIFELASRQCAELLCIALACLDPPWTSINKEILVKLTCGFLLGQPSSPLVLPRVWTLNPNLFLFCMVELFRRDSSCLPRLLDIAQELKILPMLLDAKPHSFALELASLAARRDILNLEKWLGESLTQKGDAFVKECIVFLCQKVTFLKDNPNSPGAVELHATLVAVHSQLLRLPAKLLREFTDMLRECGNVLSQFRGINTEPYSMAAATVSPPGIISITSPGGATSSSGGEAFEAELEEETNALFDRIFAREITIPEVLEVLRRQRHAPSVRDHQLFNCFLHNLFDEYRFFSKYPESELGLTAILFGQIIDSGLLSGLPALQVALRCVLEALKKPTTQKLFKFGIQSLAQFHTKIRRWPQFCQQLLVIGHLRDEYSDLYSFVEGEAQAATEAEPTTAASSIPTSPEEGEPAATTPGTNPLLKIIERDHLTAPTDGTRDRILFIINNLSPANLEKKANDLVRILEEAHFAWLAQYLVVRRASLEPNYHSLYLEFLETLQVKALEGHVLGQTYASIYVLLESPRIVSSSAERSLLKNLGSWLGSLTLARNRPILYRDLCLKELLMEAFNKDLLVAVLPFVCKVMEKAAQSIAFRPENPWLMALLRLLAELYNSERLKLNLKFEIEVLGKALAVDISSLVPTKLLLGKRLLTGESHGGTTSSLMVNTAMAAMSHPLLSLLQKHHQNGAVNSRQLGVVAYAIEWSVRECIHSSLHATLEGAVRSAVANTLAELSSVVVPPREATMTKLGMELAKSILATTVPWTFRDYLKTSMIDYLHYLSRNALNHGNNGNLTSPWLADQVESLAEEHLEIAGLLLEKAALDLAVPLVPLAIKNAAAMMNATTAATMPVDTEQAQALYRSLITVTERLKPLPNISYTMVEEQEIYNVAAALPSINFSTPKDGNGGNVGASTATSSSAVANAHPSIPSSLPQLAGSPTSSSVESMESASLDAYFESVCTKFVEMMTSLERAVETAATSDQSIDSVAKLSASHEIRSLMKQIILLASSSPIHRDELCLLMSQRFMQSLYRTNLPLLVDVLILLLIKVFEFSAKAAKEVTTWVIHSTDERKYSVLATAALFASGLVYVLDFDGQLARQIENRKSDRVVWFAVELIRACVFGDRHVAAPYDFVFSLEALSQFVHSPPVADDGKSGESSSIVTTGVERRLHTTISTLLKDIAVLVKAPQPESQLLRDQITFCFTDWFRLCQYPSLNDKLIASFVAQLLHRRFLIDEESARLFFQICTELAIELYVRQRRTPAILAYRSIDAFARLLESIFFLHPANTDTTIEGQSSSSPPRQQSQQPPFNASSPPSNLLDPLRILTVFHSVVGLLLVQGLEQGLVYLQKPFTRLLVATANGLLLNSSDRKSNISTGGLRDDLRWSVVENLCTFYMLISPRICPTFLLGWLEVVCSRALFSTLLEDEARGWPLLYSLLAEFLATTSTLLFPQPDRTEASKILYKGLVRIFLVILHDAPDFLVARGRALAVLVPPSAVQLKNVLLAALPSSSTTANFPDPTGGIALPILAPSNFIDLGGFLNRLRDDVLALPATLEETSEEDSSAMADFDDHTTIFHVLEDSKWEFSVVNRLMILLQIHQLRSICSTGAVVDPEGLARLFSLPNVEEWPLVKLCRQVGLTDKPVLARYAIVSSLVDGLTVPTNPLTHLNYHLLMKLFSFSTEEGALSSSQLDSPIRDTIVRCLLERLVVHRPHAWGVMYTLIQLVRERERNGLFQLGGIKKSAELQRIFESIVKSCTSSSTAIVSS